MILRSGATWTVALLACSYCAAQAPKPSAFSELITRDLPELKGKDLTVSVATLEYQPGGSSPVHRHPGPVFVYVLEGSLESQSDGGPAQVYTKGQLFYEPPGSRHLLSRNASQDQPVKILIFFVSEKGQPTTVPAK